ncbi:PREDICTED: uncharacterized protein LOC109149963 [Ipomoea nil]|uniref:uncharacterized protein LOC109149963 n=1 Tax=Ipomoea nil TaxID=35883 RepID=UPI000901098B|nr:PREDICTED: uncharacterized protein LOC109149963 [Ipomoea nil]
MASNSNATTTIILAAPTVPATPNPLSAAHHFVSMKLTTRNYLFWRTQLLPFLRGQGLLGYIDGSFPCPPETISVTLASDGAAATTSTMTPNPAHTAWVQQDRSILSLVISSFSDEVMHHALGRHTAKEVWDSVTTTLASTTRARSLSLLGQFQNLRQGSSSPADYLGKAQTIVEALALAGRPLSPDEQLLYVLRGLRPEFRAMASLITVSGNPITLSQLADHLQAQEFIHAEDFTVDSGTGGSPSAFFAGRGSGTGEQARQNGGRRQIGGGRGRQGRGRGNNGRGRGGTPRCQICRSHGHTAVYWFKRYADRPQSHGGQAHVATSNEPQTPDAWYPDTAASSHATPDDQMMQHSEAYSGGDVLKVGNGAGLDVSRVGHAVIPSR